MAGLCVFLSLAFATPAAATVKAVTVDPVVPASCDSVTIQVSGDLPSNCYGVVGAQIRGPEYLPCARPTPCPARFVVEITVSEPNPLLKRPCLLAPPYLRAFAVGKLLAGEYLVEARERVVPFAADTTDSVVSESFASGSFIVQPDSMCPARSCYILGFAPEAIAAPPIRDLCTVTVPPGGTACLDLTLTNSGAVAGLQTTVQIADLAVPPTHDPISLVSAEPIARAAGFQLGRSQEIAGMTRFILYSTGGATIEPGDGPVIRICYGVPSRVVTSYQISTNETIVADPAGNSIPPCPTFAMIPPGIICVVPPACDVNGDGVSDVLDVIRLVRCALAGGADSTAVCPDSVAARSDCNADGSVDVRDVVCCVRKIVAGLGASSTAERIATNSQVGASESAIGFEGVPHWINDREGVVMLRIDAAEGWGGMQFAIDPGSGPVRIGGMAVDGARAPAHAMIESATDASGMAHAIVYGVATGGRPAGPIGIVVSFIRSGSGTGTLRLTGLKAGSAGGDATALSSFNSAVEIGTASPPAAPALLAARPNPTSGSTEIGFVLPADARVTLRVYDVAGRLIRTLVAGPTPAGAHRARWDGLDARGHAARSGIYFAKLQAGGTIRSEQILLLR